MKKRLFILLTLAFAGSLELSAIDRGLGDPNSVYIPKGTFAGAISAGFNSWNANAGDDLSKGASLLGLLSDVNGEVNTMTFGTGYSWFFKDNMSVGARFDYGMTGIDSNNLKMLGGMVDLSNKHVRRETYTGALSIRRYIPLFNSKLFAIFGEGRIKGSFGYNKSYAETDRGKEGVFSSLYSAAFDVLGGASFFITNFSAIEISIPTFTIGYEWEKQLEKQEYESAINRTVFKDKFDVLRLDLSMIIYF